MFRLKNAFTFFSLKACLKKSCENFLFIDLNTSFSFTSSCAKENLI